MAVEAKNTAADTSVRRADMDEKEVTKSGGPETGSKEGEQLDKVLACLDSVSKGIDSLTRRMDAMEAAEEKKLPGEAEAKIADKKKHRKDESEEEEEKKKEEKADARRKDDDDDDDDAKHRKDDDDDDKHRKDDDDDRRRKDARRKDDDDDDKKRKDSRRKDDDDDDDGKHKMDDDDDGPRKDARRKDARRKDDDDDDDHRKDARSDAALPRHIRDELTRFVKDLMPRERDVGEDERLTEIQARFDSVYSLHGRSAPRPMAGETPLAYRRRMLTDLKADSADWKNQDIKAIVDRNLLDLAEKRILADSAEASRHPVVTGDQLRMIETRSPAGHTIREFYGTPGMWMQDFAGTKMRVARIRNSSSD